MINKDNFLQWIEEITKVEESFTFGIDYFDNENEINEQLRCEFPCKTYKIVVQGKWEEEI